MAALLVAAGIAITQKVQDKKQAKRDKKTLDAARYKDLERETTMRLERTQSGTVLKHYDGEEDETEEERKVRKERERWEGYENRDAGTGRGEKGNREKLDGGDGKAEGYERAVEHGSGGSGAAPPPGYGEVVQEKELGSRNPFRKQHSSTRVVGSEKSGQAPEIQGFVGQT